MRDTSLRASFFGESSRKRALRTRVARSLDTLSCSSMTYQPGHIAQAMEDILVRSWGDYARSYILPRQERRGGSRSVLQILRIEPLDATSLRVRIDLDDLFPRCDFDMWSFFLESALDHYRNMARKFYEKSIENEKKSVLMCEHLAIYEAIEARTREQLRV